MTSPVLLFGISVNRTLRPSFLRTGAIGSSFLAGRHHRKVERVVKPLKIQASLKKFKSRRDILGVIKLVSRWLLLSRLVR